MQILFQKRVLLLLILLGAFFVRLYRFSGPIADWHSWRQADTSAVSRNFVTKGFDVFHPRFDDLSNVPSGLDNPNGYRFVEFPIYNLLQAGSFELFDYFTLEEWGRLVSIAASLCSIVLLFFIVRRHASEQAAFLTAGFYAFLPYSIYYSRTILPDTSMVAASLAGIYFFDRWTDEKVKSKNKKSNKKALYLVLSIFFTAIALLLKPYAVFFALPIVVLAFQRFGISLFKKWEIWIFALFALLPLILWRRFMLSFPEGIPANSWLLNGNGIRFRPAFFRWILYERLTKLIFGYVGLIPFLWAFFDRRIKNQLCFLSFLVSSILYITIFATGNVQHDYYQILIIPSLAIFFGLGAERLLTFKVNSYTVGRIILGVCIIGMLVFAWSQVKDYFNINNPNLMVAGKAVDTLIPKDAKIIAPLDGDTTFLYQTKRQGWASFEKPIPDMIKRGASYIVLVNPKKEDFELAKQYQTVASTKEYLLIKLPAK
jgi:4-amino-4-deoxy-L-arabinose transferase-like glycosyltransferase